MERTSLRTPSPGQTNMGYTNALGVRRVSTTRFRSPAVRRNRRRRVTGNAMKVTRFEQRTTAMSRLHSRPFRHEHSRLNIRAADFEAEAERQVSSFDAPANV